MATVYPAARGGAAVGRRMDWRGGPGGGGAPVGHRGRCTASDSHDPNPAPPNQEMSNCTCAWYCDYTSTLEPNPVPCTNLTALESVDLYACASSCATAMASAPAAKVPRAAYPCTSRDALKAWWNNGRGSTACNLTMPDSALQDGVTIQLTLVVQGQNGFSTTQVRSSGGGGGEGPARGVRAKPSVALAWTHAHTRPVANGSSSARVITRVGKTLAVTRFRWCRPKT